MTTSNASACEQEGEAPNTTARTQPAAPSCHSNGDKPVTVNYPDGDVYEGELLDGKRHGKGLYSSNDELDDRSDTIHFDNGGVYEGELKKGKMHGKGVTRYGNGNVYDGEWKEGKQHGIGTFTWENGNVYTGEWEDGLMQGTGTYSFKYGDVYEGEFENDIFQGKGTLKYKNGGVYVGDWKEDKKHGKGTQRYANGSVYVGQFENGARHGRGILKSPLGGVYDGQWVEGNPHGRGTKTYASGNIYEGCWVEGKRHGEGTLKWKTGDVYGGEFVWGIRHGWGALTSASGDVYEGQWVEGKRHGKAFKTKWRRKAKRREESSPSIRANESAVASSGEISSGCNCPEKLYSERQMRSEKSQQRRKQNSAGEKICERCGLDDGQYKLRVCSGCNLALYCSAACQKAASGSHRRICNIVSQLPSKDADGIILKYDREKMVDLDAGLRYATKYMDKMKHLEINLTEMDEDDAVKLSAKQVSALLESKKGALETFFCGYHNSAPDIFQNDAVWTNMCGLKQLHLHSVKLDVQCLYKALYQQRNTLLVLCLPWMGIDWYNGNCRKTLALAVSFCRHLVKIDLDGCMLLNSDLKIMLQDMPSLRSLSLSRQLDLPFRGYLDSTCDILAKKCPTLQYLNLAFHDELSSAGIRQIFEHCVHLRSFHTTTPTLSFADIADLLDAAPQLMRLTLDDRFDVTEEQLDAIVEATGGRTLIEIMGMDDDVVWNPDRISAKARERYECQREIFEAITSNVSDPEVSNEWAGMLEGDPRTGDREIELRGR